MVLPIEPPPTRWRLPPASSANQWDVAGVGADLEAGTLLAAYRQGLFPMPLPAENGGTRVDSRDADGVAWWSPDPRGVIPLDGFHVSRSLRRVRERYSCTIDRDFAAVVEGCADPRRSHGWIDEGIKDAYGYLHELGWAHSVEAWSNDGELVGGVYGIAIGSFFAGESMFSGRTNGSKVALAFLVDTLREGGTTLFDVQWQTDHLASLGCVEVPRTEYLKLLEEAIEGPLPAVFGR